MRVDPLSTVAIILLSASPAAAQLVNPANGHTYLVTEFAGSFTLSRAFANATGGYVASLTSSAESQWVMSNLSSAGLTTYSWIGLTDEATEGVFLWESGEPFSYANWMPGEPSSHGSDPSGVEDFAYTQMPAGLWFDGSQVPWPDKSAIIEYESTPTPGVTGFSAAPAVDAVNLSWQNPIPYDSIEVHLDGELVLTLPGTATQCQAPWLPVPYSGLFWVIGKVAGSPSLAASIEETGIASAFHLYIPPVALYGSHPGEARVLFDNALEPQGWSFAVCHDPGELALLSAEHGSAIATVNGGAPAEFADFDIHPAGFSSGVIINLQTLTILPAGVGREFAVAEYQALDPPPAVALAEFCTITAFPFLYEVSVFMNGGVFIPVTTDGVFELLGPHFIRADANGDLSVDVADPIFLGAHLFGGGDDPPCRAACDANYDQLVNVADIVFTLGHLFSQTASPSPPFPECGPEPVPSLECAEPAVCP